LRRIDVIYILLGGAAGGSKSKILREIGYTECLRVNGFRVLLLRRTYKELDQTHLRDAEIEAPEMGAAAVPSAKVVRFPNGSVFQFGHCETTADAANYLSAEYDLILFDELVTFEELQFLMISSRARSNKPGVVPKVMAGTNPGGPQSHWVKSRFIDKNVDVDQYPDYQPDEWAFIQSKLDDNPYLDKSYERKLLNLPPEMRKAYRDGDWDIFPGQYFPEFRRKKHVDALREARRVPLDRGVGRTRLRAARMGADADPEQRAGQGSRAPQQGIRHQVAGVVRGHLVVGGGEGHRGVSGRNLFAVWPRAHAGEQGPEERLEAPA
jgi:hypothetical protein